MTLTNSWARDDDPIAIVSVLPWITVDEDQGVLLVGTEVTVAGFRNENCERPSLRLHSTLDPDVHVPTESLLERCWEPVRPLNPVNQAKRLKVVHDLIQQHHMDRFKLAIGYLERHGMLGFEDFWSAVQGAS